MPTDSKWRTAALALVIGAVAAQAAAQGPEIELEDLGEFPESVADVRDPEGPVTAEELARGNVFVPGEPVHDNEFRIFGMTDRLEWQSRDGDPAYVWDAFGYAGGDYNRLWIESEGEGRWDGKLESADLQVLYARAVTPYWNLQAGYRRTFKPDPDRNFLVLAAEGLNVYYNSVEADLYVSEDGDVSGLFEVEYDGFLTQRLVAQPRAEVNWQAQDVPEYGLGAGITSYEVGLRVRYEFAREFAPYVGVSWRQTVGETEDMLPPGADDEALSLVAGLRMWF